MIHRLSWPAIGRALWAALRAIAGPTLPLAPAAHPASAPESERMAAEIEAFVIALHADLISAEDFAGLDR
jgi:hypothetical protein